MFSMKIYFILSNAHRTLILVLLYTCQTFPHRSVDDMFAFVKYDIDNEHAEFTRSLAWRGRHP